MFFHSTKHQEHQEEFPGARSYLNNRIHFDWLVEPNRCEVALRHLTTQRSSADAESNLCITRKYSSVMG